MLRTRFSHRVFQQNSFAYECNPSCLSLIRPHPPSTSIALLFFFFFDPPLSSPLSLLFHFFLLFFSFLLPRNSHPSSSVGLSYPTTSTITCLLLPWSSSGNLPNITTTFSAPSLCPAVFKYRRILPMMMIYHPPHLLVPRPPRAQIQTFRLFLHRIRRTLPRQRKVVAAVPGSIEPPMVGCLE